MVEGRVLSGEMCSSPESPGEQLRTQEAVLFSFPQDGESETALNLMITFVVWADVASDAGRWICPRAEAGRGA